MNDKSQERTMMKLETAVKRYVADPAANLNTPQSIQSYRRDLNALAHLHPGAGLEDITEDHLVAFCAAPGLASATVVSRRTRVSGLFSWAYFRQHTDNDVSANLKRIIRVKAKPVVRNHWLTEDEVTQVFDSIDIRSDMGLRDLLIARLGFTCGLRRTEITHLTWEQVDENKAEVFFTGKGRKTASVWLNEPTCLLRSEWRARYPTSNGNRPVLCKFRNQAGMGLVTLWGQPLLDRSLGDVVRRVSVQAGVPFRPHDMRRSFAGILQDRGVPIEDISAALRHSNIGTTQRYLETRQDAAYQAVKKAGLTL